MHDKTDTINLYKMCKQLAELIGKSAESTQKLGKVVETNTNNLNMLATKVLELEKKFNTWPEGLGDKK